MTTTVSPGATVYLDAYFQDSLGALADPDNPTVSILDASAVVVVEPVEPDRITEGHFQYPGTGFYTVPSDAGAGLWTARWNGVVNGEQVGPIDDLFEVVAYPAIAAADLAAIRALIGSTTPPTDGEIAFALERLGTVSAVALEVLETRYAAMVSGPAKWALEGDASFDYTETIKALRAKLTALKGDVAVAAGTGGPITVSRLLRGSGWRR